MRDAGVPSKKSDLTKLIDHRRRGRGNRGVAHRHAQHRRPISVGRFQPRRVLAKELLERNAMYGFHLAGIGTQRPYGAAPADHGGDVETGASHEVVQAAHDRISAELETDFLIQFTQSRFFRGLARVDPATRQRPLAGVTAERQRTPRENKRGAGLPRLERREPGHVGAQTLIDDGEGNGGLAFADVVADGLLRNVRARVEGRNVPGHARAQGIVAVPVELLCHPHLPFGRPTLDPNRQAWLYAAATVALWSTVATAFEIALRTLSPATLLAGANAVAVVALASICLLRGELRASWELPAREHLRAFGLGLLNPLLYYLVLLAAYDRLPGQVAQPLNYTWAITFSLLAIPLLGQRLVRGELSAMFLAWVGVLLIATDGDPRNFATHDLLGVGLALASTFIWALYWIAAARDTRAPVPGLLLNFSYALPLTIAVAAASGEAPNLSTENMSAIVWVGLAEMAISFVFWLSALQRARSAAAISSLIFVSPFLSLVLLSTIAGEAIRPSTPIGLAFIVAGMLAQQRLRARAGA